MRESTSRNQANGSTPARFSDPEALPPRRIFYAVQVEDLSFLGLIVLLWFWVGGTIDGYLGGRAGSHKPRRRVFCKLELVVLSAILLLSVAFACWYGAKPGYYQHVAIWGLIWPAALLAYVWLVARPGLQETVITGGR
jgi:hypothetical protein